MTLVDSVFFPSGIDTQKRRSVTTRLRSCRRGRGKDGPHVRVTEVSPHSLINKTVVYTAFRIVVEVLKIVIRTSSLPLGSTFYARVSRF